MNKLLFLGLVVATSAVSRADALLQAQIKGHYQLIARASVADPRQIVPRMGKLLTSDFKWVESGGSEYNREFYLGYQNKAIDMISKIFVANNEMLSYKEDGIYVRCRVKSTMTYRRKGFSADRHSGVSVSDDIWVRTIHGWKMYKSVGILDSDTIAQRPQSAAVMTARMTSAGVVHPAAALAFPSSSMVR